jgi:UDP-2,3-diacylglucosamine hydrolase
MSILFISDLHLSPANKEQLSLVCNFLNSQKEQIDQLYILGDLFNTWLGDDIVPEEFLPFIDTIRFLSDSGIDCFLMVGNRDFMLGKQFAQQVGCKLISDPYLIELNGISTLLMHGDTLCTDDVDYQKYRRWTRKKWLQWLFLRLPRRYRNQISDKIKQQSNNQKQYKSAIIMDVNQQTVERTLAEFDVDLMIHGHTHRPAIHQLGGANRIVLGDWQTDKVSYLFFDGQQLILHDHRIDNESAVLKLS